MKAARLTAARTIELCEVDIPEPSADEVLIRTKAVGICGSDLHIYQGHRPDIQLPRVMGHEISGEIVKVGKNVGRAKDLREGDKVVVDPVVYCGECYACRRGKNHLCTTVKCLGCQVDGGFTEYFGSPAKNVYTISDDISWNHAALAEPFSIGAQVFSRSEYAEGERVVIFGAGTIGLCVLQVFKLMGAKVLITDIIDSRLEIAKSLGADVTVNNRAESLAEKVAEFTENEGADVVIEAAGHYALVKEAMGILTKGGRIVVLGLTKEDTGLTEFDFVRTEIQIRGSVLNSMKFPQVIEWMNAKKLNPEPLITGVYPVEKISEAFETILASPAESLKVLVTF